ncbi:hypothetical protein VM1G_05615 [Cytospora mali]|uniref:Uncharacterized protein n=1 Tax=Cytospora mali TaxID=578113 RepID=A0A194W051_CYTMA|nr:hypothetical protein VM1G_05615 [Valsa mali]
MDQEPHHQGHHSVFREDELDNMLAGIKDYLREATRTNAIPQDQGRPLENGLYTVNESDAQALLYYILNVTEQLRKERRPQSTATGARSSLSLAPRFMRPVTSTTVDPATTLTISEASFTPAVDLEDDENDSGRQRAQTANTSTVNSQDSMAHITWLHPQDSAPAIGPELEAAFDPPSSPGTLNSKSQLTETGTLPAAGYPEPPHPDEHTAIDSRYSVMVNDRPGASIGNNTRKRRQTSEAVFTDKDEPGSEERPRSGEGSDQPASVLEKIRKKSVQFGQAMGSFMNGAYQNADHKPRRESSVVRMRGILDRIQPSRPKPEEDLEIYSAFTGARPITPIDQWNSHTRRPKPASDTCSEDGRRHKCVQHEADMPSG